MTELIIQFCLENDHIEEVKWNTDAISWWL